MQSSIAVIASARGCHGLFWIELRRHGLTEQQWRVMRALDEYGELETGRVAEEAFILAPSLSGVLERMENADLVTRFRLPCDKRKVHVALTPKSREIATELRDGMEQRYQCIESLLSTEILENLINVLDQVVALPTPKY